MNILEVLAVFMRIYRHLDWLSVTLDAGVNWRQFVPGLDWLLDGAGRHGYKRRYVDRLTGIEVETDSSDDSMGHHFTMTGEPLAELRATRDWSDDNLALAVLQFAARVSRVDLTIDVWGCSFTPAQLAKDLIAHRASIRARKWRLIEGHDRGIDGDTLDTGSPVSDKRFRLYDKYAEKRIKDREAWMRLELQLRRKYAKNALSSCADNGVSPTITGHIADYLHWQNEDYSQVLTAESVAPAHIPRIEGKRALWLKGQVARALAAEMVKNPGIRAEFDTAVGRFYELLTKGVQ